VAIEGVKAGLVPNEIEFWNQDRVEVASHPKKRTHPAFLGSILMGWMKGCGMNFYQFHVGDYAKHTAHLTSDEDLAYRRLLDLYYDTEAPIPNNIPRVSRRIRVGSDAVANVLSEFFELTPDGYRNRRADAEIEKYYTFLAKQKANGIKGGRPKKPMGNPTKTQAEPKITLTNTQLPITNIKKENIKEKLECPEGVQLETWQSFLQARKTNKAIVTPTVVKRIAQEAQKAGWTLENALTECVARGWRGFKAEWVADKQSKNVGERNRDTMAGLTRGLIGGGHDVKLIK